MQFKQTGTERKIVCEFVMVKNKEIKIETEKDIPTFGNVQVGEDIEIKIIPNAEICFPLVNYSMKLNHEIFIPIHKCVNVELTNEFYVDEICDIFEKYKRVMVRADLPGYGKS